MRAATAHAAHPAVTPRDATHAEATHAARDVARASASQAVATHASLLHGSRAVPSQAEMMHDEPPHTGATAARRAAWCRNARIATGQDVVERDAVEERVGSGREVRVGAWWWKDAMNANAWSAGARRGGRTRGARREGRGGARSRRLAGTPRRCHRHAGLVGLARGGQRGARSARRAEVDRVAGHGAKLDSHGAVGVTVALRRTGAMALRRCRPDAQAPDGEGARVGDESRTHRRAAARTRRRAEGAHGGSVDARVGAEARRVFAGIPRAAHLVGRARWAPSQRRR